MVWQRSGTVAVQNGSTTVVGTNVDFAASSRNGDSFVGPDGATYEVANVASSTVISILPAYKGPTVSGSAYAIMPVQGYDKMLSDAFNSLNNQFGPKLAALGTTGNYDILPVAKGGTGNSTGTATKLAAAAIAGTVSQSGGLPTGALMESGVNGAGQYWRFAGGLQVCINEFTTNLAVNQSANGMFYTSTAFAMPAAFASGSTPQFSFSARLPGAIVWGEFSSWNGAVAEMFIISGSSTSAANIIVKMIAVGRWF